MTPADLDTIEARASAATPGMWWITTNERDPEPVWGPDGDQIALVHGNLALGQSARDNAAFIAASRQDVPLLCAALRRAWAVIEKLEGETK